MTRARDDLRGAEIDLAAAPPLIGDALFHCQQAAEKCLKAFLTFHNRPFRRTHNLEEIGEACLAIDPTLLEVVNEIVPLCEYAWAFRYPGPTPEPSLAEATEALAQERLDGISVNYATWHFNVRASNAEPLIRLNLEATSREEIERQRDEVLALVRAR